MWLIFRGSFHKQLPSITQQNSGALNAEGQLSRLEKNILSLDHMPERFRRYSEEPWLSRGLRIMPVDNYCVFYIPDLEKKIVNIIRVLYGGRDIDTELAKHTAE